MRANKTLVIILALLFIASLVYATGTLAGTIIKNQASATYKDANNTVLTSTSNEVITTVLPKYAFSVGPYGTVAAPGQSQSATVGNTVYYQYILLNSSNIADTYTMKPLVVDAASTFTPTNQKIYKDVNGNGIVDPGDTEIIINSAGAIGPVAPDSYFYFIVAFDVPLATAAGKIAYTTPEVDSVGDGLPGTDKDNISKTTVVTGPVVTANITATPTTVKPTDTVVYTISGSNTGTADAKSIINLNVGGSKDGILVVNQLPANETYKAGSMIAVGPAGSIPVWSTTDANTWVTTEPADPLTVKYVGLFMPDATANGVSENVLAPGQSYSLTYSILIAAAAPAGIITDDAIIRFNDGTANTQTKTNTVDVLVVPVVTAAVAVGPKSNPDNAGFVLNENDIATAPAGGSVTFYNALKNKGTNDDVFDFTFNQADYPVGSVVLFYYADGVNPLSDTDSDGKLDTGIVAPNATFQFVVKVLLPGTALNTGAPHELVITATSSNNPAVSDPVTDRLNQITRPGVDIGNTSIAPGSPDNDGLVSDVVKDFTINPGSYADIPLDILNNGRYPDTMTLSINNLPAGYTVIYYLDKDNDGILDADELTPISSVNILGYSGSGVKPEVDVIARLTIPKNAPPLNTAVSFIATSSIDPTISDTIVNNIIVPTVPGVTFAPDRNGTGIPGGTVTYSHVLTNTGNKADTFALSYVSSNSWNYIFYDSTGSNEISTVALAAGEFKTVIIKGFIPTNSAANTVDTMVATALGTNTPVVSAKVTDNTIVIAGVLQLTKRVDKTSAQPGENLTYSIDYRNISTVNVKELVVVDPIPQHTELVSLNTTVTGPGNKVILFEYSLDGITYTNVAPVPLSGVKFLRWRFTADNGVTYYDIPSGFDSLSVGKTLTFQVKIK